MAKISRRAILAAGMALPATSLTDAAPSLAVSHGAVPDPLVARAGEWIALRGHVDALSEEADDLQGLVFNRARLLGVRGDKACGSSMSEARAWRAKKREFEEGSRQLERLATQIRRMRASTVAGAIARIELSLHIQYEEWSEHAFEFVEDGIIELRRLTASAGNGC